MIIDEQKLEIGEVIVSPSECTINGKQIQSNKIYIISKDQSSFFSFWMLVKKIVKFILLS